MRGFFSIFSDPLSFANLSKETIERWCEIKKPDRGIVFGYTANFREHVIIVKVNDFPAEAEHPFTLLVDGQHKNDFDEIPKDWYIPIETGIITPTSTPIPRTGETK